MPFFFCPHYCTALPLLSLVAGLRSYEWHWCESSEISRKNQMINSLSKADSIHCTIGWWIFCTYGLKYTQWTLAPRHSTNCSRPSLNIRISSLQSEDLLTLFANCWQSMHWLLSSQYYFPIFRSDAVNNLKLLYIKSHGRAKAKQKEKGREFMIDLCCGWRPQAFAYLDFPPHKATVFLCQLGKLVQRHWPSWTSRLQK